MYSKCELWTWPGNNMSVLVNGFNKCTTPCRVLMVGEALCLEGGNAYNMK